METVVPEALGVTGTSGHSGGGRSSHGRASARRTGEPRHHDRRRTDRGGERRQSVSEKGGRGGRKGRRTESPTQWCVIRSTIDTCLPAAPCVQTTQKRGA